MALFCLRKVSTKNSSFTRACVLVALFLPFFFSFLDVCVLSWPADVVFSGCCLALDERVQHTDQKTYQIFSQKSLHIISHLIITDIKRTRRAFTLSRERESLGALNSNNNNNNDSFFIVSAFFLKIVLSRARAYNICASCAHFNHPSHGAALSHVV